LKSNVTLFVSIQQGYCSNYGVL